MKTELRGNKTPSSLNPNLFNTSQYSLSAPLQGCLGTLDAACIEKLLLHCASALESNDITSAQQVMWVLNNVASSTGDPNQRLTSCFLKAFISRASRVCPNAMDFTRSSSSSTICNRLMTVTQLAGYVDLIPWHRFGFCGTNSVILKAIQGCNKVHILDFSISHCMQWPTLIDTLAKRVEGPPSLRISVPSWRPQVPPFLDVSSESVGQRLKNFAKFKDVPFEFNVIQYPNHDMFLNQLNPSTLNLKNDEILVVNCQNWLRYLPVEAKGISHDDSCRDMFLEMIKGLNPRIMTVVDEDCDLSGSSLGSRITACLNYLWIPFDALETFLAKDSSQRLEYEADIGHKIENIIGFEGNQRIERLESGVKMAERIKKKGFVSVPFCDETVKEVKFLIDEYASGWGMKKEDDMLVLTWKGHNSVYSTAWVPSGFVY